MYGRKQKKIIIKIDIFFSTKAHKETAEIEKQVRKRTQWTQSKRKVNTVVYQYAVNVKYTLPHHLTGFSSNNRERKQKIRKSKNSKEEKKITQSSRHE